MKSIYLKLTLKEALVISQTNATEGAHQSLDYLPGATILGALASRFYADFKKQCGLAYDVFHSGKVRFHNAYPLLNTQVSLPVPLSLHYDKLGDKKAPRNYLQKTFDSSIQGKQHRKGFVAPTQTDQAWSVYEPKKTLQMRTAINPSQGVAEEAQLYGYQMLQAGEVFMARLDCDTDEIYEKLHQALTQLPELFLGRSRSAQYGKVGLQIVAAHESPVKEPVFQVEKLTAPALVLWLASDMAVYNALGQPTLAPTLQELGLKTSGKFVPQKSFVRTRSYAPYNGFRRTYDLERQLLAQGSILCYQLEDDFVAEDLATLQSGLGSYTESGLGQIVLAPEHWTILLQGELTLQTWQPDSLALIDKPQTDLMRYLSSKTQQATQSETQQNAINMLLQQLQSLYRSARNYNGLQAGQPFGPTKSQWGALRNYATKAADKNALQTLLFGSKDGFIREKDEHWDVSTGEDNFMVWIKKVVQDYDLAVIRGLSFKVTQDNTLLALMEGK